MMKKFITLLLSISMLWSITVFAEEKQSNDKYNEKYYITDADGEKRVRLIYDVTDGEATINDVHVYKDNTDLVFPAEIDGYPVKRVENISVAKEVSRKEGGVTYTELEETKIKSVTFEEGIESLRNANFSSCKNLTKVKLADSIKSVEDVHFSYLPKLVTAELGDGLESASYFSVFDCPKLKEIKIPDTLKYTSHGFNFGRCVSLASVKIPSGLEEIPEECFYGCTGLKDVTIENGVKVIGNGAFAGCTALENIVLPSSVISVGKHAFGECNNLEEVTMSKNIKYIGESAFEKTTLDRIQLPKGLEEIGEHAFSYTPLIEITIPQTVKNIEKSAFSQCTELKKLTISDKTKINQYAFSGCNNLSDVTVNDEMKRDLFEALLKASVQELTPYIRKYFDEYDGDFIIFDGNYLAKYKGTDKNPVIPEGVTELGEQAFHGADIDSVIFPSTKISEIPPHCFQGSKIRELTVPATVGNIREYAFYGCYNLEKLTIESGVKSVSDNAFLNCSSLTEQNVSIGKGVHIGGETFKQTPLDKEWMDGRELEITPNPTEEPKVTANPSISKEQNASPASTAAPHTLSVKGGDNVVISVNGLNITFPYDAQPFIDDNGRTQVPIRVVAEMLSCGVVWSNETNTALITNKNGDTVKIAIDSNVMTMNETPVQMDSTAIIKNDRTYIPVRYVAEALGLTVKWIK